MVRIRIEIHTSVVTLGEQSVAGHVALAAATDSLAIGGHRAGVTARPTVLLVLLRVHAERVAVREPGAARCRALSEIADLPDRASHVAGAAMTRVRRKLVAT